MSDQKFPAAKKASIKSAKRDAPIVRMVDIDKWFGKVCALRNIDFM